jgi:hypothetical protein
MAYIPSLIGVATLVVVCYMLSVMTLTALQLTAGIAGASWSTLRRLFCTSKPRYSVMSAFLPLLVL